MRVSHVTAEKASDVRSNSGVCEAQGHSRMCVNSSTEQPRQLLEIYMQNVP